MSKYERMEISVQKRKIGCHRTVLNTCLSFLNEVKNLGKEYGCYIRF
ncbi:hypothetical protein HMPREF1250_0904 [Megasphaera vaginalis (ex Srinivasan et al. 2021)]|uniref:Uncharacterized protein n=1 Tax=Megasphaera vaginalis (ex Srinivasan et al. 2021) TaxID=1111454 RepID=U7UL50_9FIRM|nr:hypothetical protein HMPREF1250_0904 [Megasphaera vaginalis (ex Srinivasan et al. 2021)]